MRFETKFNLNDEVYLINLVEDKDKEKCEHCEGKGHIIYKQERYYCRKCNGDGHIYFSNGKKWVVDPMKYIIVKIRLNAYGTRVEEEYVEEEYICNEDGIPGGGFVCQTYELLKSIEEAQEEADTRNENKDFRE